MSKHNYSQYSKNENKQTSKKKYTPDVTSIENPEIVEAESVEVKMVVEHSETAASMKPEIESAVATPAINPVQETVETKPLPKTVPGTVVNCSKLNVRRAAISTAEVVTILAAGTKVEVEVRGATASWLKVITPDGKKGYCMRQYINATL